LHFSPIAACYAYSIPRTHHNTISCSYSDNRTAPPHLQFKAVASKLPGVEGVLLNGLDARMKDIESLRDVHDNLEGLLAVPTYDGPLADMTGHKK
jgi:hypothetical protein